MNRELTQEEKDRIVKHAQDICILEVEFEECLLNSDDEVIERTPFRLGLVYNREIISEEEVDLLLKNGKARKDPRILMTDLDRIRNIFPHTKMEDSENGKK